MIGLVLAASDQNGENAKQTHARRSGSSGYCFENPLYVAFNRFMWLSINVKLQRPTGKFLQLNSYDGII
jgi:hypothetical protein